MHDLESDNEYLWDKKRFLNRQVHMQEMYQEYEEKGQIPVVDNVGTICHLCSTCNINLFARTRFQCY